jgi:aminoglycoside phosphotransferase (APT) family kinase protein
VWRERATQNALAALGYPAPRVLLAVTDASALGGPFLVMERLPGRVLPKARLINMSRVLVDLQLRLHALDPEPLLHALEGEGVAREVATFDGTLARLEQRIAGASLSGLVPAMRWLREHRRRDDGRPLICHGDFHPQNILMLGNAVTGVLDWPNAIVAEPEFDVAATSVILRFIPIQLAALPAPVRWLAAIGQPILAARYLSGYRRRRPLDSDRLRYYEVASCVRALVRIGESRYRSGPGGPSPDPLDTPLFTARLTAHVARVTGVAAVPPPGA